MRVAVAAGSNPTEPAGRERLLTGGTDPHGYIRQGTAGGLAAAKDAVEQTALVALLEDEAGRGGGERPTH